MTQSHGCVLLRYLSPGWSRIPDLTVQDEEMERRHLDFCLNVLQKDISVSIIGGPWLGQARDLIIKGRPIRLIVTETPLNILNRAVSRCLWRRQVFSKESQPEIFRDAVEIDVSFPQVNVSAIKKMSVWNLRSGDGLFSSPHKLLRFSVEFSEAYNPKEGIMGSLRLKCPLTR